MPLQEYVRTLSERWWVVVISAFVASLVGLAFASSQTPVYRSSVRMEVGGHVDYSQVLAVEKVLRQVAAHVKTGALAREVDRRLGIGMDPESLLGKIRTQVFADSLILQIDVDDSDPARAEKLAAAVAQVVQERQEEAAAEAPETARVTAAVLDRPSPAQFIWPQTRSIVAASGLAGAIAGIVLAFILYYLDDTIPSPEEAERWLGLPLLGLIPVENA